MDLVFTAKTHTYKSIDDPYRKWVSVTKLVENFKPKFDGEAVALKSSKNKKSKWYGLTPEEILDIWAKENKRSLELGTWYHQEREKDLLSHDTIRRNGIDLPIIVPIEQDGLKFSSDQNLISAIYPEHLVYLKSAGICGQADRVEVIGDTVDIYDYKTNKEIKVEAYSSWDGTSDKMLPPLEHLDNCNLMHYALQLSIYMFIVLKHNHHLKPGKLEIHHIIFEKEGDDKYGYPITKYDENNNPIVKEVVPYELPYLKDEVNSMLKYIKTYPIV
jgi:hypothetical protein